MEEKVVKRTALIWDLDGTLLDSYKIIVDSLCKTCDFFGIEAEKEEIHKHVIKYSVSAFIKKVEEEQGITFDTFKEKYSKISEELKLQIRLIDHAAETLEKLSEKGARHFVFTHRGKTTESVLKALEIYDCFEEIITSQEGFARKPEPDAINYLMEKYGLDPENTYYVGDRTIDMECAKNANIRSILYLPKDSYGEKTGHEDYVVEDLLEIVANV